MTMRATHSWKLARCLIGQHRRGLTLLELLLAASITVMVGAAIVAMLGAVNAGVGSRRDTRAVMTRAMAARGRLASYITPARCMLAVNNGYITIWLDDSRASQSVHATEIRWLRHDPVDQTVTMYFVTFPDAWSQAAKDIEDAEYPSNTDWDDVLIDYQKRGYVAALTLIDGVSSLITRKNHATVTQATHFSFDFEFTTGDDSTPISIPGTIAVHHAPAT